MRRWRWPGLPFCPGLVLALENYIFFFSWFQNPRFQGDVIFERRLAGIQHILMQILGIQE